MGVICGSATGRRLADPSERTFGRRRVRLRVSFEGNHFLRIPLCEDKYANQDCALQYIHRGMSLLHIIA